ncbi:MAG: 50S ribosomal protein L1 [Candidatus Omnitrophica bacterium]|nr:50S ribosomal protein L1 [Candidatus Omnitrophota bacterium]MBU1128865.1 50S ribosomal protein L1 [Candidatus Omnitrophota bacterium]MBU1657143.1 50S ribosomal protein L1 [Candidatus Omnitrophota bacterium]MBU1784418.1 50S ribosomal protein L1 [Candidatus Omnitrophota bacterium]MBU1851111.1 50S ribosomal protein L1 [Candidatus Omnitrophota bacterium]
MTKLSKRKKSIEEFIDREKEYTVSEAVALLKKAPPVAFDQTVEIAIKLDLDQTTTPVRGTVSLPNGTGKTVRVAVFCKGDLEKEAKDAGADFVGSDCLLKKVSDGWCDFDVAVTTPEMMKELARFGKVLGPRGLMPNPKSGTVTQEIGKTVKELKGGKIEFKMDKQSGIRGPIGKISFSESAIVENINIFIKTVMNSNPKLQKIQSVKSIAISSTMGPGLKLDKGQFKVS